MNLGYYGYLAAAAAYGFLTLMLLISWRGSQSGRLLTVAVLVSVLWSLTAATLALESVEYIAWYRLFEVLRFLCWYVFLISLLRKVVPGNENSRLVLVFLYGAATVLAVSTLGNEFLLAQPDVTFRYTGHVFFGLFGLVILEQLYRNTDPRNRWALKFLVIGAGMMFAFDFYLYSDALLFRGVSDDIWEARGFIHVIIVPLLLLASSRNKHWTSQVFVSRDIVFTTTAVLGGGLYLLSMSFAGFYLREFGGDWGRIGELVFISLMIISLVTVLFSASIRSRLRVFLGKHFFRNKYDYRIEWLRLTDSLGNRDDDRDMNVIAIEGLGKMVEARAGMLWLCDETHIVRNVSNWKIKHVDQTLRVDDPLVAFLREKGYVINLLEIDSKPGEYEGLELPAWIDELESPWLIVPLYYQRDLQGFMLLCNPLTVRPINWEDRDLLKTAARQVANFIMARISSEALAEAKQFEVFSRLSAYMVHDLKNIASELEMTAQNAKRHKSNPAFVDDAFDTIDNASVDIKRLLEQLRNRQAMEHKSTIEDLAEVIGRAAENRMHDSPSPTVSVSDGHYRSVIEHGRLINVLGHLIENAQQACEPDGRVDIGLDADDSFNIIRIEDDGHGMDQQFIKERLFKPFDTTKGNAGMGIGMHESREFVRQFGGDIRVQSVPGQGTSIELHIPRVEAETEDQPQQDPR